MVVLQLLSPNYLAVFKIHGAAGPIPWRAEPGPIKVVAIEDGDDYFKLDGGGVVVAEILADDHNVRNAHTSIVYARRAMFRLMS